MFEFNNFHIELTTNPGEEADMSYEHFLGAMGAPQTVTGSMEMDLGYPRAHLSLVPEVSDYSMLTPDDPLWQEKALCAQTDPVITNWTQSPWSASRVVFAWWLAICTGCYLFLWAMKAQMDVLSGSAPLLLGINGGTLLAASFVGSSGRSVRSRSFLEDIVSEGGEAEISRLQMIIWNGVLGLVFIWQSLADWQMPTFDPYLTTLLGISSTAYVWYKVAAK